MLLSGFKPVFQALNPTDVNKLAFEIVQTLQGESGNVESLLGSVSSLTQTLAGRDKLIGDVIRNLSKTLDIVGSRDAELSTTIRTLREFIGGLKDDREDILDSLDGIADLTDETADLLKDATPLLAADLKQLNRLTANLSKPKNLAQAAEVDPHPSVQADEDRQLGRQRQHLQSVPVRVHSRHWTRPGSCRRSWPR